MSSTKVHPEKLNLSLFLLVIICLTFFLQTGCGKKEEPKRSIVPEKSKASKVSSERVAKESEEEEEELMKVLASLPDKDRKELEKMLGSSAETKEDSKKEEDEDIPKWFEPTQESKDAINAAINALRMDYSDEEKLAAVAALDGIDNPDVFDAVMMALDEGNVDIREAALDAVMEINDPVVIPVVNKALEDEDPEIRSYALDALMDVDDEKVNEPLMKALEDENVEVRENATDIMLYIESPNILPSLAKALNDENEDIRDLAIITLEDIEDKRTLQILIEVGLLHKNEEVREDVLDSIEFMTDQEFKDYEEAQRWLDAHGDSFEFE